MNIKKNANFVENLFQDQLISVHIVMVNCKNTVALLSQ